MWGVGSQRGSSRRIRAHDTNAVWLRRSAAHPFYTRLNQILDKHELEANVEGLYQRFDAEHLGRLSRWAAWASASSVSEHWRKHENHQCRPCGVHGQIRDLPFFESSKRAFATQEG